MLFDANMRLGRLAASDGPSFDDAADLVSFMDEHGLDQAVVYHALARESDFLAGNALLLQEISHHRDRLMPAFVVVPNRQPVEALVAQLDAHDVPAVRLFPMTGHFSIAPWCIGPLADALTQAGKAVIIDYETVSWAGDATDWRSVDELCAAFPRLNVILAGVAVAGPSNYRPLMAKHRNLHIEISKLATPGEVQHLIHMGSGSRVLYGSDMPTRHFGAPLHMIRQLAMDEAQRQAILGGNLARVLGVSSPVPERIQTKASASASVSDARDLPSIIDTHVHLGGWNPSMAGPGTADETVADMDRCGIRRAVATSLWACYGQVARGNESVARAAAKYPGRIHGYITLDPKHPAECRRQLAEHGSNPAFVGIKLHGQTHAVEVTDPRCKPILEYAHERQWPLLIHGSFHPQPWQQVATRFPRARFIVPHVSGCGLDTPSSPGAMAIARLCRELDNLYIDIASSCAYFRCLPRLIELAGADRILYGSDHPIFDFAYELGQVLYGDLQPTAMRKILHDNAAALFGFTDANAPPPRLEHASRR